MATTAGKSAAKKAATPRKTTARKSTKQKTAKKPVEGKSVKPTLVRDSFTIPDNEYALLAETKKTCLKAGFEIKKSELIRIGIAMVHKSSAAGLKKAARALQPVKTGRPKKHK